eukprot:471597-Pyramimonas_sp.AAC.1
MRNGWPTARRAQGREGLPSSLFRCAADAPDPLRRVATHARGGRRGVRAVAARYDGGPPGELPSAQTKCVRKEWVRCPTTVPVHFE